MAVGIRSVAEGQAGQGSGLSDYEKLRLEKIKRNEDRMKELGLFKTKDALAASAKKKSARKIKKTPQISPELPQRRSSRKRKTIVNYSNEQVIPMYQDDEEKAIHENSDSSDDIHLNNDDEEDDYEASDEDDNDDGDEILKEQPKKRSKFVKPNLVLSESSSKAHKKISSIDTSFDCVNPKGGLTLEYAKSGRSSCRKCRSKIEKGRARVGMEAWIVGRNAMTWQLPKCLLQNLCCVYEKSNGGKGKCKASHTSFAKGQLKIGIRCHTATNYYRLESIGGVLTNVVALMRSEKDIKIFELKVDDIDGNQKLSEEDRHKLASILEKVFRSAHLNEGRNIPEQTKSLTYGTPMKQEPNIEVKNSKQNSITGEKPKVGAKTSTKGKVEWKFGGRSCYGTLIPRMETKTHCYARTHKGNVKTLAKGKDYWTMLG